MVIVDKKKCNKCGACIDECLGKVLEKDINDYPQKVKNKICVSCGHCMAMCMEEALFVDGVDSSKMRKSASKDLIKKDHLKLFLESKRSWRRYLDEPVKKEDLEELLEVAQIAPTAANSQDKSFVVIEDKKVIDSIRHTIIKKSAGLLKITKFFSSIPFKILLPKITYDYILKSKLVLEFFMNSHITGEDYFLYCAPAIVLFTGSNIEPVGKDNALYAMNNFMLLAETMGLGTCINGFISANAKKLTKFVNIPKYHKIYGALTIGYKKGSYYRTIYRNKPSVNWV